MKKILGVSLVLTLLLTLFTIPAGAQMFNVSPFFNFENCELGDTLESTFNISLGMDGCYGKVIKDPTDSTNKVYGVFGTGAKLNTIITYTLPEAVTTAVTISYDYLNTKASVMNDAKISLRSGTTEVIGMTTYGGLFYKTTGGFVASEMAAENNTWYHIDIEFIPGESVELFIDGVSLYKVATTAQSIDNFYVYNRCTAISNAKIICFDNLSFALNRENFENYELENEPSYFETTGITDVDGNWAKIAQDPSDEENNVYAIRSTYSDGATADVTSVYPFGAIKGKIVFAANYMTNKTASSNGDIQIRDNKTGSSNNYGLILSIGINEGQFCYVDGDHQVKAISSVVPEKNKWYQFAIVMDLDNDTADIYIDGVRVVEETPIRDTKPTKLQIYNRARRTTYAKTLYLDNFFVGKYGATQDIPYIVNEGKVVYEVLKNVENKVDLSAVAFDVSDKALTYQTDKGTVSGNVLTYMPETLGQDTINVTVTDGDIEYSKEITLKVVDTVTVTVVKEGNGTVNEETAIVKKGGTFTLTATPDEQNMIEYVKYNGAPVLAYETEEKSYMTPALTKDCTISVKFSPYTEEIELSQARDVFIEKEDGINSACVLATAREKVGDFQREEFGVIILEEETEVENFNLENASVVKAPGVTAPNMLGQYGIKITGEKFVTGTYYVRPYAIYNNSSDNTLNVYGDVITLVIE